MKLAHILLIALVLVLASCGKPATTGNTTKDVVAPAQKEAPQEAKPADTTPKPVDNKVGVEAAGLFEAKYCNFKVGALQLQINSKKESVKTLEAQQDKDGKLPASAKDEIAKVNAEIASLNQDLSTLQDTCKQSKFSDKCDVFQKDIQSNIDVINNEMKDDQESLQKWSQKLQEAKDSNKIMDITIAQAKTEKLKPRITTEENQIKAFNIMLEDLKRFC